MSATSGAGTAYPSGAPEFIPVFSGVRVTRSLVLCVGFVDRCLSFCPFSFDHCVVCSSSIYGFWLPLWYLQTLLDTDTGPGPGFLASDAVVFIVFSVLWREMVARFVDIRTIKNGVLKNCLRLKLLEITWYFI
jgi:hypothetical protein